jgi:Rod binding domain-containing protein
MNAALNVSKLLTQTALKDPFAGMDPKLVKQTQTWVGQTFFGTILRQMRESPFKDQVFSGGRGGEAFGAMYDQRLAEHMTRGAGTKLVRAIVRKIEAKKAYQKQTDRSVGLPKTDAGSTTGSFARSKK